MQRAANCSLQGIYALRLNNSRGVGSRTFCPAWVQSTNSESPPKYAVPETQNEKNETQALAPRVYKNKSIQEYMFRAPKIKCHFNFIATRFTNLVCLLF